jgi:hypothetical protein
LPKQVENRVASRVLRIYDSGWKRYDTGLLLADSHTAVGCRFWSLQKGDNMKLRHLAAIAVLLTLGCQSGDTPSTPQAEDTNATETSAATDTSDSTSSVDPVTEDTLMKVSLNVTGMK